MTLLRAPRRFSSSKAMLTRKRLDRQGLSRWVLRDLGTRHACKGYPGTWDGVSTFPRGNGTARETELTGRREVGARSTSDDAGELAPEDPAEQRSAQKNRLVGGKR